MPSHCEGSEVLSPPDRVQRRARRGPLLPVLTGLLLALSGPAAGQASGGQGSPVASSSASGDAGAKGASGKSEKHDEKRSAATPAKATTLQDLAWFSGRWEGVVDGARVEEHWMAPDGGAMIGMSRTIADGKMVIFEFLRLEARPDGIVYIAHPAARPGVEFKLTRLEGGEALFENPGHDFPKRIRYRKNPDGSITARIEGDQKGQPISETFEYRPMK